jgi:RimJ/RimL family protein N-acetyltransferase
VPDAFPADTERLRFREWRDDDLELAMRLWGDAEVTRFISRAPLSRADVRARLEREIESARTHGIQYWPMFLHDGDFAGCAGLRHYEDGVPELGVHVVRAQWKKGLAREAGRAVARHAFERGARAVFAGHHPANEASRAMLRALGFVRVRDELYPPTGAMHPSYLLSVDVRAARAADAPRVVALVRDTLAEFGLRFGEGAKTDVELAQLPGSYIDRGGAFFVAVRGGEGSELLGTAGMFPVAPHTFELRKMYLAASSRGLGIGQRLLDASLRWTRAHDGHRIVLDTTEKMTRAIAFYEANGFVRDDAEIRGARCTRGYALDLPKVTLP